MAHEIKKHTKKIASCNEEELVTELAAIKVNLNGYGCHGNNEYPRDEKLDFFMDEHIWKEIDNLETECEKGDKGNKKQIEKNKKRLCRFLILLLKFDWERSKDEITKNMMAVCSVVLFCLVFLLCSIQKLDYSKEIGVVQIQHAIQEIWVLVIPYFILWSPYLLEKLKILRTAKWYKDTKGYPFAWIFGILVGNFVLYRMKIRYNISIDVPMMIYLVSALLTLLYPLSIRKMYMEYDNHIMEILQLNSLVLYPMKTEWSAARVSSFFIRKGMNYRQEYKTNDFFEDEEFKSYINSISGMKKYKKVLTWLVFFDYSFRKKKDGLYQYMLTHPNRIKCIVKYQQNDKKFMYSAGYQKNFGMNG